jgi:hypothetical protein
LYVNRVSFTNTDTHWATMQATGRMEVDQEGGEALLGEGGALSGDMTAALPGVSEDAMASFCDTALAAGAVNKAKVPPKKKNQPGDPADGSQNRCMDATSSTPDRQTFGASACACAKRLVQALAPLPKSGFKNLTP